MSDPPLRLAHRGDHSAHRGGPGLVENSEAALLAAASLAGCDGVEFDVRLAADGVPVVYHDESLQRIHGLDRRVADTSAAELERIGVATLEAIITALPRRFFLDIELKVPIGRVGVEVLAGARGPGFGRAVISSFDEAALEGVRARCPGWACWLNALDLSPATLDRAREIGCVAVGADWRAIDRASMTRARSAGLDVAAWTVRRRATYDRLARLGVVAIAAEGAALRPTPGLQGPPEGTRSQPPWGGVRPRARLARR